MFVQYLSRIRSARINNILENCLATIEARSRSNLFTKEDFRAEVELFVDTYPGLPQHSMRTGEYFFPLRPDPIDLPDPDAFLENFRNIDHAETLGVPNSTKKRGPGFRTSLGSHLDKPMFRARRSIKKAALLSNAAKTRNVKPTSSVAVRKRTASAESEQACAIGSKLQVMNDKPIWDSSVDEMRGACAFYFVLFFQHFLISNCSLDSKSKADDKAASTASPKDLQGKCALYFS